LGNEVTSKSCGWYGQTSQNGRKDLGESFKSNKKGKNIDLRFKIYEKWPFSIHLKVRRPVTPLVERKKEKKWGQFDIFNVMFKSKVSFQPFQSIRQYTRFIWEVTLSERMETNKVLGSPIIQNEELTAYIKRRVITDVPEDMDLENLMQQVNSDT
jgi:hypothetical protein